LGFRSGFLDGRWDVAAGRLVVATTSVVGCGASGGVALTGAVGLAGGVALFVERFTRWAGWRRTQ
jgi:uncharacterized protein (TIGR03382 family)